MRREKASLPVDVRRSKTSVLKFPNQNNSSQPSFYADRILWPIIESAYVKGIEKMFTL